MAVTETLRTVLDAGGTSRRLDELSTARVILKIAEQVHEAQHKAGPGKAVGPVTPAGISIETATGAVRLGLAEPAALAYAAPEQLGGGEGDRRSDVWSLGVVMWEALTHQPLFEGGDQAAIEAAVRGQIVDPPATLNANIPAELSAICMRSLARNPADRYQSAKVMGAELEAVLDDAGYGDSDDKLREYMATLGHPKREPKLSAPPLAVTPADMLMPPPGPPSSTAPGVVIPRGDAPPAAKATQPPITVAARATGTAPPANLPIDRPSILDQAPAKPPASMIATSAGSLATQAETPALAPARPGANLAAALASAGTQPAPASTPPAPASTPPAPAPLAKPAPERVATAAPMPASSITAAPSTVPMAPVLPKITSSGTVLGFPAAAATVPATAQLVTPVAKRDPTPAPRTRAPSHPDPATMVTLPKASRESAEVLGGWGWGTDSHPAIKSYEADDDESTRPGTNKRLLFYVFGGGFAVVAIILIVVFAFGGTKPAEAPLAVKTGSGSGSAEIAYGSAVEYGKATGDPTGGSGSNAPDPAGSNTVAAIAPAVVNDAAITNPAPPDAAPVATQPVEPATPKQPEQVAVAPAHHADKHVAKRPEKHAERSSSHLADPFATQHPATAAPKPSAEAAYRQGVQLFARGETSAALAQLRSAIASNPNYAPAWRGLGLVFEKMGDKDQARSAYNRYLKLAPTANDSNQVRNRMERLGS
ncbi:MAG: tetratricopeptide repeat protein [Kofleriaceae bacterium]